MYFPNILNNSYKYIEVGYGLRNLVIIREHRLSYDGKSDNNVKTIIKNPYSERINAYTHAKLQDNVKELYEYNENDHTAIESLEHMLHIPSYHGEKSLLCNDNINNCSKYIFGNKTLCLAKAYTEYLYIGEINGYVYEFLERNDNTFWNMGTLLGGYYTSDIIIATHDNVNVIVNGVRYENCVIRKMKNPFSRGSDCVCPNVGLVRLLYNNDTTSRELIFVGYDK